MTPVKICPICAAENDKSKYKYEIPGWISWYEDDVCMHHPEQKLTIAAITQDEMDVIFEISKEPSFAQAMNDLKEKDIIEYNLKISQFKAQLAQQESVKPSNQLMCPKCGSTAVTTGARGVNHFWGFVGASKTVNRCGKCGHCWKP